MPAEKQACCKPERWQHVIQEDPHGDRTPPIPDTAEGLVIAVINNNKVV
jgi:hypothetical protein